jgi:hypothetical protein
MANRTLEELYNEVLNIGESGGEQAAKDFIIKNLNEFPEEEKNSIIVAFVEEALTEQKEGGDAVAAFQQEGLAKFKEMVAEKKMLEDKDKMLEIKESL